MDANKKALKKAPPPVPKFVSDQNQYKDPQLQKKLNSFLTQLEKQSKNNEITKQQQLNNHEIQGKKKQTNFITKEQNKEIKQSKTQAQADKKKLSLASINSKLNSMLNSKKLTLNKPPLEQKNKTIQLNPQKKQQKKRNESQTQYDPNQPNNYDLALQFYLQKLQKLNQSSEEQEQQSDKKANKIGYNNGLKIKEMIDEAEQNMAQQQQNQGVHIEQQEQQLEQKQQLALRMMQKLGYKVGEGLGKQSQGIKTPLTIKKTTDSSCTIEQSSISLNQMIRPQTSAKNALLANNITITQVIVFINLVSISQLSEQVQTDLKAECQNYGKILNYIAYMMKDAQEKSQMRIFFEFGSKEEAFSLFAKLNNKFYNQKHVSIRFYPKQNFQKIQLNLKVHQHIQT